MGGGSGANLSPSLVIAVSEAVFPSSESNRQIAASSKAAGLHPGKIDPFQPTPTTRTWPTRRNARGSNMMEKTLSVTSTLLGPGEDFSLVNDWRYC